MMKLLMPFNHYIIAMLRTIRLFCCLLLLAVIPLSACANKQEPQMTGTDGKQYVLSDFVGKGKWVVVNVWATACPYCRSELFDLNNFHEAHYLNDAMVLGLTLELSDFSLPNREYVAQFKDDYLMEYPVLLVDQSLAEQVIGKPVEIIPLTFFYNPEGKLVYQLKGVLSEALLESIIQRESTVYEEAWSSEVPPEYKPQ